MSPYTIKASPSWPFRGCTRLMAGPWGAPCTDLRAASVMLGEGLRFMVVAGSVGASWLPNWCRFWNPMAEKALEGVRWLCEYFGPMAVVTGFELGLVII